MKKLFLTSGVILCLACPAFAEESGPYDINNDTNHSLQGADPAANASCQYPTLGDYTGPRTFYAKWSAHTYQVKYHPQLGDQQGSTVVKDGNNNTGENDTATVQTTNATYNANYTVLANTAASLGTQTEQYFTKYGYNFAGWKSDHNLATGDTTNAPNMTPYTGTSAQDVMFLVNNAQVTNLYATWTPKEIPVVYNENVHGTATTQSALSDTVTFDTVYTTKTLAATTIAVHDGYEFLGWGQTNNATGDAIITAGQPLSSSAYTTEATLNLYAIYNAITYNLIYDCGSPVSGSHSSAQRIGSLSSTNTFARTYDAAAPALFTASEVCKLDGYHIDPQNPWTCVAGVDTPISDLTLIGGSTWQVANNVTCTANWVQNTIGLSWDVGANSTRGTAGGSTCTYDAGITVEGAPTRAGYDFQGWTTSSTVPQGAGYVVFTGQASEAGTSNPAPAQQDNN